MDMYFLVRYYVTFQILLMCVFYIITQFSLQDNGSAKYFQGAMHTPNMGEKVAQVSEISSISYIVFKEQR